MLLDMDDESREVIDSPSALTPNTVELFPTPGDPLPRGGPVPDPVLIDFRSARRPKYSDFGFRWLQTK